MLFAAQGRHVPDNRPPLSAACPHYSYRRRIGIMGGSFNPAHNGHLQSAVHARRAARLDEVWWLVSPQNPLKPSDEMASFSRRIASASCGQPHRWIKILDFEQRHGLKFTADNLTKLARHCPRAELVWIMGADNLIQFLTGITLLVWQDGFRFWSSTGQLSYKSLTSRGAALLGRQRRTARRLAVSHADGPLCMVPVICLINRAAADRCMISCPRREKTIP